MAALHIVLTVIILSSSVVTVKLPGESDEEALAKVSDQHLAELVDVAVAFNDLVPNEDLYFLGQSLAWVGKVLEEMSRIRPTKSTWHYVPFSGKFLELVKKPGFFTSKNQKLPSKKAIEIFKTLLRGLGLDPKDIVERYTRSGRRTVVADFVDYGSGLASFLYILKNWAAEENVNLGDALQVLTVICPNRRDYVMTEIDIDGEYRIVPTIMEAPAYILNNVSRTEEYEGFERLVVPYKHYDWEKNIEKHTLEDLPYNVKMIQKIRQFIRKYILQKEFEGLMEIAEDLSLLSNTRMLFLENLAWVGRTLEMMSTITPTSNTFGYVNFSSNFVSRSQSGIDISNPPSEEETRDLRIYLRSLGLDPENIVWEFFNFGRRTLISGNGINSDLLASIMYFLYQWAAEEEVDLSSAVRGYAAGSRTVFMNLNNSEFIVPCLFVDQNPHVLDRLLLDNDPDFPRFTSYYPSGNWNQLPPELDQEQKQRIDETEKKLKEAVKSHFGVPNTPTTLAPPTRTYPTLVLRTPTRHNVQFLPVNFELQYIPRPSLSSWCTSIMSRFRRDLKTKSRDTMFQTFEVEYAKNSRQESFIDFVKDQYINHPQSSTSKILHGVCDEFYKSIYYNAVTNESGGTVRFNPNQNLIFTCMKRHRLFRCNENWETRGLMQNIAATVAKNFSGKIKTRDNVEADARKLIQSLVSSYPKFSMNYLVETTKQVALYCSDDKVVSTMECPSENYRFLGQIMLSWSGATCHNLNQRDTELGY